MLNYGYRAMGLTAALAGGLSLFAGCSGETGAPQPGEEAVGQVAEAATVPPPPPVNGIICTTQSFPEVTWKICLVRSPQKGVWISSADIQRKPGDPFLRVLSQSGPAEIFVP